MPSRMDRYRQEDELETERRSRKNQELYENIGKNTKYTNFTDVTNANAFDIGDAKKKYQTREGYHKMKEYGEVISEPKVKRELDDFNYLYQKRKLKNTNYNILASLNPEELEKYRKEKIERNRPDEGELRDLIDTITSKTLAGELDQKTSVDLLSDLMATSAIDRIEAPEKEEDIKDTTDLETTLEDITEEEKLSLSKEILDKDQIDKVNKLKGTEKGSIMDESDTDFYTRSMDLSDKDFDFDDEFQEKKMPIAIKIILILLVIAVLAVAGYFVYKNFF